MAKILSFLLLAFFIYFSQGQTNVWIEQDPNNGIPLLRSYQSMTFAQDSIYMFYGYDQTSLSISDETWIYNINRNWWTLFSSPSCSLNLEDSGCPSPRIGASLLTISPPNDALLLKRSQPITTTLLMFGGETDGGYPADLLWSFDTNKLTWSLLTEHTYDYYSSAPTGQAFQSAIQIDDEVLIFGGETNNGAWNALWSWNLTSQEWLLLGGAGVYSPNWGPKVSRHTAVNWQGKMVIYGGCSGSTSNGNCVGTVYSALWIYDPVPNNWTKITSQVNQTWPTARRGHVATMVDTDLMMIYGGQSSSQVTLSDLWEYNFTSNTWQQLFPSGLPSIGRYGQSIAPSANEIYLFGGLSGNNAYDSPSSVAFYQFDPTDYTWSNITSSVPSTLEIFVSVSVNDQLFVLGTFSGLFSRFDTLNQYWQPLTNLSVPTSRQSFSGFLQLNSTHLAGFQTTTMYTYDLAGNYWNSTRLPFNAVSGSTTTRLGDNSVLVLIGTTQGSQLNLFDTLEWNATNLASNPYVCQQHTAVFLGGFLYVIGAQGLNNSDYLVYDIGNNSWSVVSPITSQGSPFPILSRWLSSAVAMGIHVILFGGESIVQKQLFNDLWALDTTTNLWTLIEVSSIPIARESAAMSSVNSTLLVFGGSTAFSFLTDFWAINLGCNPGSYCNGTFLENSCEFCSIESYSFQPGTSECIPCPFGIQTNTTEGGATSVNDCKECIPGYCNFGYCTFSPRGAICSCHWGFFGDRCTLPWGWIGITAAILLIVAVASTTYYLHRKIVNSFNNGWDILEEQLDFFPNPRWTQNLGDVVVGGNAYIYPCSWRGFRVAVKILPFDTRPSVRKMREFEEERQLLKKLRHPNIVLFLGTGKIEHQAHMPTHMPRSFAFMVTAWSDSGDLRTRLNDKGRLLTNKEKVRFCLQIAKGMAHLHELGIIHRDLKPENILVFKVNTTATDQHGVARTANEEVLQITDFGSAISSTLSRAPFAGTAPYGPVWEKITKAFDVFSFGVIMLELVHGDFTEAQKQQGFRRNIPNVNQQGQANGWYQLMQHCCREEPKSRPSFAEIITTLSDIQSRLPPEQLLIPLQPQLQQHSLPEVSTNERRRLLADSDDEDISYV